MEGEGRSTTNRAAETRKNDEGGKWNVGGCERSEVGIFFRRAIFQFWLFCLVVVVVCLLLVVVVGYWLVVVGCGCCCGCFFLMLLFVVVVGPAFLYISFFQRVLGRR